MISIVVTIDKNYTQHCAVTLISLLVNNKHLDFTFYIIHNKISPKNIKLLKWDLQGQGALCHFIALNDTIFKNAYVSNHITIASYFRLLIPDLLPPHLDKVLYLDADLIVRDAIDNLWNIDITSYSHAGVENPLKTAEAKSFLGLGKDSNYFNAGILLINLTYWRENDLVNRSLDFINRNTEKIIFHDQDTLNYLLEDQWLQLPYCWNVQEAFFFEKFSNIDFNLQKREYDMLIENPTVLHYTGSDKPWFKENIHPFKSEYYKYLALTSWKNYKPISNKPTLSQRFFRKILRGVNYLKMKIDNK